MSGDRALTARAPGGGASAVATAHDATQKTPADPDCIRILEARRIAHELGDDLWPGWSQAPFGILLITENREYLCFHPDPGDKFESAVQDDCLDTDVYARDRVNDRRLLATYPAFGTPVVVIGQPKYTEASHSTRWTMTLLHEHFHQWQQSWPDYYDEVKVLDLAGDDETGMWMLNYPFPYDDPDVNEAFNVMCRHLRDAVLTPGPKSLAAFQQSRAALQAMLGEKDYAYMSFQLWQEGVARYTEYALASRASARFRVSAEFEALPDYETFADDARQSREHLLDQLLRMSLRDSKRSAFYPVGAAEAILLDRVSPNWRSRYMKEKFFLERYYPDVDPAAVGR